MSRRRLGTLTAALAMVALTGVLAACGGGHHPTARGRSHSPSPSPSPSDNHEVIQPGRPTPGAQPAGGGPSGTIRTTGSAMVALTFDDGPSPDWTPKYLALLSQYHLHATFCMIGREAAAYPQLVRQVVQAGHTLCNHTWDHDEFLSQKSPAYIQSEMTRTLDAIRKAVPGAEVPYYRQPGGNWSPTIVSEARSLGMRPLHWSVDPQDWRKPPTENITGNVESNTQPGSIVLMHDAGGDRSHTYAALQILLPYLVQRFSLIRL